MTNILFLTIDALRKDHLSIYGYSKNTSPYLLKNRKLFVKYNWAYSPSSYTKPSMYGVFTSSLPFDDGGYYKIKNNQSIVSRLQHQGYSTYGYPNTPILSNRYGFSDGFDEFINPYLSKKGYVNNIRNNRFIYKLIQNIYYKFPDFLIPDYIKKMAISSPYNDAEIITKYIINKIKTRSNDIFIWAHYMDTHIPYQNINITKTELFKINSFLNYMKWMKGIDEKMLNNIINIYDLEIKRIDYYIGKIIKYLIKSKKIDDYMIIITADHGEEFMDHGSIGHIGHNYKSSMFEELINVPLIIKYPINIVDEFNSINKNVSTIDIFPTIFDVIDKKSKFNRGVSISKSYKIVADRLVQSEASLYNKLTNIRPLIKSDLKIFSLKYYNYKYIHSEDGSKYLYYLNDDPKEKNNIIDKKGQLVSILSEYIELQNLRRNFK